jgi:hypothetical protein
LRSPANGGGSPLGRHTNGRPSSAGELTRQPMLRPVSASEASRQSGLRLGGPGEIRSHQPRSPGKVPRLHLVMLQMQMQQEQRQMRESSFNLPGRLPTGHSGIGSCSSSPRRGPGVSKTVAREAAADLIYGSMLQQQQQPSSSRLPTAAAAAAAAPQPPPWNSGSGCQRRYSQANPSSPAKSAASPRRSVYFAEGAGSPPLTSSGADGHRAYGGAEPHYDAHDNVSYAEPHSRDDNDDYDYHRPRGGSDRLSHQDSGWY